MQFHVEQRKKGVVGDITADEAKVFAQGVQLAAEGYRSGKFDGRHTDVRAMGFHQRTHAAGADLDATDAPKIDPIQIRVTAELALPAITERAASSSPPSQAGNPTSRNRSLYSTLRAPIAAPPAEEHEENSDAPRN